MTVRDGNTALSYPWQEDNITIHFKTLLYLVIFSYFLVSDRTQMGYIVSWDVITLGYLLYHSFHSEALREAIA